MNRAALRDGGAGLLATLGRAFIRQAPGSLFKDRVTELVNAYVRAHPRRRVVGTRSGLRFAVDTEDLIQRYLWLHGTWEPHLTHWLTRRLRAGHVFVDVGANIGYYSVLAAHLVGSTGKVVAIEAHPDFHSHVVRHVHLNGYGTIVRAVQAAVSDEARELEFIHASQANWGSTSILPWSGPAQRRFTCGALPLPELLEENELSRARIIKVDVEGAEGSVIRGLGPALGRLRSDVEIAVEVTPERIAQLGDSVGELLRTMGQHGFHTYRIPNSYAVTSYPTALRRPLPPVRWTGPVTEESDLIFSRVDADSL